MLLLIIRARSMTRQQLLRHTHRALLLEWLDIEGRRRHGPVLLGWVRGHTNRRVIPYVAQRWCDEQAPLGAAVVGSPRPVSAFEGRFVLMNQDAPVVGSWKDSVLAEGQRLLGMVMLTDDVSSRGEVDWHRLAPFFSHEGWNMTSLLGRGSTAAAVRWNAEADTVTDPLGERWGVEAEARAAGTLHLLERHCLGCQAVYHGSWEAHVVGQCEATRVLLAEVDSVAVQGWAQESAWDFREAEQLFQRHHGAWRAMVGGGTWHGFELTSVQLGVAPVATGLAATDDDLDVWEPTAVRDAAIAAGKKQAGGAWERRHWLIRSTRDPSCTLVPARFFELWDTWQGDATDFERALPMFIRHEKDIHGAAQRGRKLVDDYWC